MLLLNYNSPRQLSRDVLQQDIHSRSYGIMFRKARGREKYGKQMMNEPHCVILVWGVAKPVEAFTGARVYSPQHIVTSFDVSMAQTFLVATNPLKCNQSGAYVGFDNNMIKFWPIGV